MRKIEVKASGVWVVPVQPYPKSIEEGKRLYDDARYVGGVLEYRGRGMFDWAPFEEQQWAVLQAKSIEPNAEYRLRPYDDAVEVDNITTWIGQCDHCISSFRIRVPHGMQAHHACHCGYTTMMPKASALIVADFEPASGGIARGEASAGSSPPGTHTTDQRTKEMRSGHVVRQMTPEELLSEVTRQAAKLADQRETIRSLMKERDILREFNEKRAEMGDALGTARSRITELEAECFRLRRRAEDAERAARRGKR